MSMDSLGQPSISNARAKVSTGAPVSKAALWAGRVCTAIPAAMLVISAVMKFTQTPEVVEGFVRLGWSAELAIGLGIVELLVTIVYLVPPTAVLGAILVTGYLGGAVAAHARIGEPWFLVVIFGVLVWLGLFLREPRLRALIPIRGRAW